MNDPHECIITMESVRFTPNRKYANASITALTTATVSITALIDVILPCPARAEMAGGFNNIYSNKTCYRNDIPARCDVYYSPKDVTWRVHWRDTGLIEYYLRRGGNWFEIRNSYGDSIGAAELIPDRQILRLIRTGGGAIGSVKIFDLE
jgi:hypothetical protein